MTPNLHRILVAGILGGLVLAPTVGRAAISDQTRVTLEALSRLKDTDLDTSPALKQAVLKVLDQVRGEPEFVAVVRDFRISGQEAELIRFAQTHPGTPEAIEALRLSLTPTGLPAVQKAIQEEQGPALVMELGQVGDPKAISLLQGVLTNAFQAATLRKSAVKALAKSADGTGLLLREARQGSLPPEIATEAIAELRASNWPGIRTEAASLAGGPAPTNATAWPPPQELAKLPGDITRGAAMFRRPDTGCATCHQVHGEGVDFGPRLSEIGAKLGKDALITAILEPSAGISFGYEGWRVELKDGSDLVGIVISETPDELVLRQPGGGQIRIKPAEITSREKQSLSLMPAGLHQALSLQEFADLIAYLSSLRPVKPAGQ